MRVIALIVVVLLLLTVGEISSTNYINSTSKQLYTYLQTAENYIEAKQWDNAEKQVKVTMSSWNKTKKWWSILLNHQEIDNIDISISRLEKYVQTKGKSLSLGELSALKLLVSHVADTEAFNFKNIL